MKRIIVLFLILFLSIPSFAAIPKKMEEKLDKHWSREEIEKEFFLYYFPYLAREDFKRLEPNEPIDEDDFILSFASLMKNYGYKNVEMGLKGYIKRIDMAQILGENLLEIGAIKANEKNIPFADIEDISSRKKKALSNLYHAGLIQGQAKDKFNPGAYTSQAEAIVMLQRVYGLMEDFLDVPFNLLGMAQSYSGLEGINSKLEDNRLIVTISKSFPNPGYSMEIEKIVRDKDKYKLYLKTSPPDKDSEQLMVITYKTITIELSPPLLDFELVE